MKILQFILDMAKALPSERGQIELIKIRVGNVGLYVVTALGIAKEIQLILDPEETPFDITWFFSKGFDQIPFLTIEIETFDVVVGHKLSVSTDGENLAVVFVEISPKTCAVKNRFIQSDGCIAGDFKKISKSMNTEQRVLTQLDERTSSQHQFMFSGFLFEDGLYRFLDQELLLE